MIAACSSISSRLTHPHASRAQHEHPGVHTAAGAQKAAYHSGDNNDKVNGATAREIVPKAGLNLGPANWLNGAGGWQGAAAGDSSAGDGEGAGITRGVGSLGRQGIARDGAKSEARQLELQSRLESTERLCQSTVVQLHEQVYARVCMTVRACLRCMLRVLCVCLFVCLFVCVCVCVLTGSCLCAGACAHVRV